jgi:hypothetical protein
MIAQQITAAFATEHFVVRREGQHRVGHRPFVHRRVGLARRTFEGFHDLSLSQAGLFQSRLSLRRHTKCDVSLLGHFLHFNLMMLLFLLELLLELLRQSINDLLDFEKHQLSLHRHV